MNMIRVFMMVVIVSGLVAGCKSASKLIGTWESQISAFGMTGSATQIMNADGTFANSIVIPLPLGGDATIKVDGTWESQDDKVVTLNPNSVAVTGAPAGMEVQAKEMAQKQFGSSQKITLEWKSADEFTTTIGAGQSATFKRKKP